MGNKINVKLILELRNAGLSRNSIASTRHISKNSVSDVFHLSDEQGITYTEVKDMSEDALYRMFYPDKYAVEDLYENPDYEKIHQELSKVGVTLKLLWEEYQDICKGTDKYSMGYTKFCKGYDEFTVERKLTYSMPYPHA